MQTDQVKGGRKRTRSSSTIASRPASGSRNPGSVRKRSSTRTRGDPFVRGRRQPNVARELYLVPKFLDDGDCRARQIGIDQKTHTELGSGQRVKRLLLHQFAHELERGTDVVGGDVIFTLDVLERHAASQAAHDHRYGQTSAPNDGLAVADGRVKDDAIWGGHSAQMIVIWPELSSRQSLQREVRWNSPASNAGNSGLKPTSSATYGAIEVRRI